MARGKQAARAANRRAAVAADTVESLRAQLAEERAKSASEISALKMRVEQLGGRLTSAVALLANEEIQKAKEHAQASIKAEREKSCGHFKEIIKYINEVTTLTVVQWMKLRDIGGPAFVDAIKDADMEAQGVLSRKTVRNMKSDKSAVPRLEKAMKSTILKMQFEESSCGDS